MGLDKRQREPKLMWYFWFKWRNFRFDHLLRSLTLPILSVRSLKNRYIFAYAQMWSIYYYSCKDGIFAVESIQRKRNREHLSFRIS